MTDHTASINALPKAINLQDLTTFCDDYLSASAFKDYAPNGLQVDGGRPVQRIVTGVTACEALIDAAIAADADTIMVHHGYFWKGESDTITGMKGRRIRKLMQNGISMIGYHLPLDAHPIVGNNAKLAEALNMTLGGALYPNELHPVGNIATCNPQNADSLITQITKALGRTPLHIPAHYDYANPTAKNEDKQIERVGICTGGAQDMIEQAAIMDCDAFISGEISERTTHIARELGIDYFACGHHATERGGIEALGNVIAEQFGLPVTFIDIDNPA